MKRIVALFICLILILSATACSGGGSSGSGESGKDATPKEDAVKIDQIDYTIDSAVVDGERRVVFSYTNNSKYTIQSVVIEHSVKQDIEDSVLEKAFSKYIGDELSVDDIKETTFEADYNMLVAPGESSGKSECLIGYVYVQTTDQYECYEPNMATIKYVADDGKLYTEYYDYVESKYSLDEDTVDLTQWGTGDKAELLPKPENANVVSVDEEDDKFSFESEGVTSKAYEEYADALKEAGFSKNVDMDEMTFDGETEDGKLKVHVFYNDSDGSMDVSVEEQ